MPKVDDGQEWMLDGKRSHARRGGVGGGIVYGIGWAMYINQRMEKRGKRLLG